MKEFKLKMPTENDWNDWSDDPPRDCVTAWNRGYAKQNFQGKSINQIIPELERNFMVYFDEYSDMPRKCFQYYIFALTQILRNCTYSDARERLSSIPDMASCFFYFIKNRAEHDPKALKPIMKLLWPDLVYVANNQEHFDASLEIYGDFRDKFAEIKKFCDDNKIEYPDP
ncbi:MAG: hypothetical protein KJ017_07765 [Alphaproteobacteria bacterium]|nr:hypothetical protein [Alphaproteobacteria bacterium]